MKKDKAELAPYSLVSTLPAWASSKQEGAERDRGYGCSSWRLDWCFPSLGLASGTCLSSLGHLSLSEASK